MRAPASLTPRNRFHVLVVEERDDGRDQCAAGTPCALKRRIVSTRRWGAAARAPRVRASRRRGADRDEYLHQAFARHGLEQVQIAFDQSNLGDDSDRVPEFQQHFENAARDATLALDRLDTDRIRAERYELAAIARPDSSSRSSSAAFSFANRRVSKTSPGESRGRRGSAARNSRCSRARSPG